MDSGTPPNVTPEETHAKIEEYAQFLNSVLRPELLEAKRLLEETQKEISEYEQLRITLQKDLPSRTTVDLGFRSVQCEAKIVENPSIFVHAGLGFHIEMTIAEAVEFVKQRIAFLQANQLEDRQTKYNRVQDHVQSSMTILNELEKVQNQAES